MINDKSEFPVYLFSNGSKDIFPDNKPGHFKNRLGQPINLSGSWEVCLSMMHYPNNWKNIKMDCELEINFSLVDESRGSTPTHTVHQIFEAGYYMSTEHVRIKLNGYIKKILDEYFATAGHLPIDLSMEYIQRNNGKQTPDTIRYPEFIYDQTQQRIILNGNDFSRLYIKFLKGLDLCHALGYKTDIAAAYPNQAAQFLPSLTMNFPSLFVYSPIIEALSVGDVSAPLLGLVPVHGKFQHYTYERFEKPIYSPLSQNYISEIEIKLTDSSGTNIVFGDGVVGLLLHFRRRP